MLEKFKLTREQVVFLIFIGALGNMVYSHTWIDDETDRAAWVATFAGILMVIPLAVWLLFLGKKQPERTVFDILEAGLGRIPCTAICILYIFLNIGLAVAMLNMFAQLLKSFFNMFTPVWATMLFLVAMAVMFVNGGLKAFARTAELLTTLGILNYFVSFINAFPGFVHFSYIWPIFDTTLLGFTKGSLFMTGAAAECLLLLMVIVAYIPDAGKRYMWVVFSIGSCAVVFSSAIFVIMAMMGPELAKRIAFGGVNAAKLIQIGDFLRGLEVFIFGTYQFIAIGKVTICLYCAWIAGKKMLRDWKPGLQLISFAALILVTSLWLNSYSEAYRLAVLLDGYVILPFSLLVLLLSSASIFLIIKKETGNTK